MIAYDMEFNFYGDEPLVYFSRQANEFDGFDPQEQRERNKGESGS